MKNLILIFVLLGFCSLSAQTKGKVTYRIAAVKDSIEQPHENSENTEVQNDVYKMLHNSLPVEGYLTFNDSIAIYKAEEKVDIPGYINITWFMAGGNSTYYIDSSRDYSITQNAIMGPTKRIIQKPKEWTITKESKVIDGYTCYLATINKLGDKKIKAWYAPKIPISHGPRGFNGLPGLIMEIEDVLYHWTVAKIDFNNNEADDIIEPVEGELMTQEAFVKFCGNPFSKN